MEKFLLFFSHPTLNIIFLFNFALLTYIIVYRFEVEGSTYRVFLAGNAANDGDYSMWLGISWRWEEPGL